MPSNNRLPTVLGKHTTGGDETPPISEEELEAQKIEHECQIQREKEREAQEAEEVRKLDLELLHQRALEAEEEHRREIAEARAGFGGMNTSWSHQRLCDLQRASRWRQSRPSVPDASKYGRAVITKSCSTQITKPEFKQSTEDGIVMNFLGSERSGSIKGEAQHQYNSEASIAHWLPAQSALLERAPSCPGCRAPIASLDCMDEFSANSQQMLEQTYSCVENLALYLRSQECSVTPGLRYKNLGKSGLRVPNVGLGLWSVYGPGVSETASEEIINLAIDSGINLFDLSEAHCAKAEIELGRILKKRNTKRSGVIILTKVYWSTKSDERGLSRKHIVESIKSSLARLQVDYIDVVLLHKVDPMCPMEEVVRTMKYVIGQGLTMYWGTARWTPSEIMEAYSNCRQFNCIPPIVEQTEYHMFCREKVELYMPELYHKIGVGMMVWSAITSGKGLAREEITGLFAKSKFNRKYSTFSWCEEDIAATGPEESLQGSKDLVASEEPRTYGEKLRDLSSLASTLNCSLSQMAIAWSLKNENVHCLLLGATSASQLKENIHALQIVPQLSANVVTEIDRILSNKPQRPPMVSTLAMRNQQQNGNTNAVTVDMTGAATGSPKLEQAVDALTTEEQSTSKDSGKGFCLLQ